jgi:hypothetical protein
LPKPLDGVLADGGGWADDADDGIGIEDCCWRHGDSDTARFFENNGMLAHAFFRLLATVLSSELIYSINTHSRFLFHQIDIHVLICLIMRWGKRNLEGN